MSCKCNQPLASMGLPNCGIVPERIVRAFLTPDLRALALTGDPPDFLILNPNWLADGQNPWVGDVGAPHPDDVIIWAQLWALATPVAEDVATEKPESIREELGASSIFVRESPRSFTFTFARKVPELGRLFAQLRCASQLGVLLVDANGVVWGLRAGENVNTSNDNQYALSERVRPIPIRPPTVDKRLEFAGANTVTKWILNFQLDPSVRDEDLVPIWQGERFLTYTPPIALETRIVGNRSPERLEVHVYARFANAAGHENLIPLLQVPDPLPTAYDANGNSLGTINSWTITQGSIPGSFLITIEAPGNTRTIRYSPSQLANAITPAGFDWYNFVIRL